MHYKAIFFDWDGTLVEQSKLIAEGHNHVRKHFGIEDEYAKSSINTGHQSTRELYPILYGDKADEAEQIFRNFFTDHHLSDVTPFDDTLTLLSLAEELGIHMGVVSNKQQFFLDREIDHIGWRKFFHTSVGAGTAEVDKPSSAPLKLAMMNVHSSLDQSNILYVGDTETDLKCAKDMGCDFLLTTRGRNMDNEISEYKPKRVSHGFSEIITELECFRTSQMQKNA